MSIVYVFLEGSELNIAFQFVILILQNYIHYSEKQVISWYLELFHSIGNKK